MNGQKYSISICILKDGCKVILLIDNASAHGSDDNLPLLQNILVRFLPKYTTSILQPMDLGVIACIKKCYQRRLLNRATDLSEASSLKNLCTVNIRLAIQWIYDIKQRIGQRFILDCWHKSGLLLFSIVRHYESRIVSESLASPSWRGEFAIHVPLFRCLRGRNNLISMVPSYARLVREEIFDKLLILTVKVPRK